MTIKVTKTGITVVAMLVAAIAYITLDVQAGNQRDQEIADLKTELAELTARQSDQGEAIAELTLFAFESAFVQGALAEATGLIKYDCYDEPVAKEAAMLWQRSDVQAFFRDYEDRDKLRQLSAEICAQIKIAGHVASLDDITWLAEPGLGWFWDYVEEEPRTNPEFTQEVIPLVLLAALIDVWQAETNSPQ